MSRPMRRETTSIRSMIAGQRRPDLTRHAWARRGRNLRRSPEQVNSLGVSLSIGIVGLPNVGKSTLFNALTKTGTRSRRTTRSPRSSPTSASSACPTRAWPSWPSCSARRGSCPPRSSSSTSRAWSTAPRRGRAGQPVPRQHPRDRRDLPGDPGLHRPRRHPRGRRGRPRARHRDDQHRADPGRPADAREGAAAAAEGVAHTTRTSKAALEAAEAALARPRRPARRCSRGPGLGSTPSLRELHLLTAKPFLYVFNLDADELADDGAAGPAVGAGRARRGGLPRRQDRVRAGRAARRRGARAAAVGRPGGVRPGPAGPGRLRDARPADLPDGRAQGDPGLDDPQGRDRARGGRRHPHRLPARLHQGRGRLLRRPGRGRLDRRRPRRGQGPHRGQGLRHARRRRRGVPLQRLKDHGQAVHLGSDRVLPLGSPTVRPNLP